MREPWSSYCLYGLAGGVAGFWAGAALGAMPQLLPSPHPAWVNAVPYVSLAVGTGAGLMGGIALAQHDLRQVLRWFQRRPTPPPDPTVWPPPPRDPNAE